MKRVFIKGNEYGYYYKGGNIYVKIGHSAVLYTERPNKEKGWKMPLRLDVKLQDEAYIADDIKVVIINDNVVFLSLINPRSIKNIIPTIKDAGNNSIELNFNGAIEYLQKSSAQEVGFKSPYLQNKYVLRYVQELQEKRILELEGYMLNREIEAARKEQRIAEYKAYLKANCIEVECEIMPAVKTASHRAFKDQRSIFVETTNAKYFTVNGDKVFLSWLVGDPSKSHKMAFDIRDIDSHYGINEKKERLAYDNKIYSYKGSYFIIIDKLFCDEKLHGVINYVE